MRIRIIELLGVMAIAGFCFASLKQATPLFESLFFNFTFCIIFFALVMAVGRRNSQRAFWIGFVAASVLYLSSVMFEKSLNEFSPTYSPSFTCSINQFLFEKIHPDLIEFQGGGGLFCIQEDDPFGISDASSKSTNLIRENVDSVMGPPDDKLGAIEVKNWNSGGGMQSVVTIDYEHYVDAFFAICHSAWALLLGWICGHASEFVYIKSRKAA